MKFRRSRNGFARDSNGASLQIFNRRISRRKWRFSSGEPKRKPCRCPTTSRSTSPAASSRTSASSKDLSHDSSRTPLSLDARSLSISPRRSCRNVIDQDEKHVTIESIQKFVADYYQLKVADLKSRNNSKSVAMPRQVAMYLCKSLTHASLPEIGRSFGGKHHSTVIHSIKKVEDLRKNDRNFNSLIESFLQSFR